MSITNLPGAPARRVSAEFSALSGHLLFFLGLDDWVQAIGV